MKRYRVRQYGAEVWTYIDITGDLASGVAAIMESSFWSWSGRLHVQEQLAGKWENLEL